MADQIAVQHTTSAVNVYALIRNADGQVYNGSTFESYQTANLGNYDVALTEQGTASRYYTAAMPSVAAGRYVVTAYQRAGASPAETDTVIGVMSGEWDGTRFTRLGAPAGTSIAADLLTIDNLVDDLESRLTSTRAGYLDNLSGGAVALQSTLGTAGSGLTAIPWNASWDAEVQSEVQDALDATLADSVPADGSRPSIGQALYAIYQFLTERAVSGTTMTVKKPDGSSTLMTFTLNDASTPTSITRAS